MTNKDDNLNEEYAKIALITAIVYTDLEKVKERRPNKHKYSYKPKNLWTLASRLDIIFNRCSQ